MAEDIPLSHFSTFPSPSRFDPLQNLIQEEEEEDLVRHRAGEEEEDRDASLSPTFPWQTSSHATSPLLHHYTSAPSPTIGSSSPTTAGEESTDVLLRRTFARPTSDGQPMAPSTARRSIVTASTSGSRRPSTARKLRKQRPSIQTKTLTVPTPLASTRKQHRYIGRIARLLRPVSLYTVITMVVLVTLILAFDLFRQTCVEITDAETSGTGATGLFGPGNYRFVITTKSFIVGGSYFGFILLTSFLALSRVVSVRSALGDIPKTYIPINQEDLPAPVYHYVKSELLRVTSIDLGPLPAHPFQPLLAIFERALAVATKAPRTTETPLSPQKAIPLHRRANESAADWIDTLVQLGQIEAELGHYFTSLWRKYDRSRITHPFGSIAPSPTTSRPTSSPSSPTPLSASFPRTSSSSQPPASASSPHRSMHHVFGPQPLAMDPGDERDAVKAMMVMVRSLGVNVKSVMTSMAPRTG